MVEVLYIILGAITILVPGFFLSLLLYPKRDDLDFWERVGVSVGLGVLALILITVVLAQPGLKAMQARPFFGMVAALSVVCITISYWTGGLKWVIDSLKGARVPGLQRLLGPLTRIAKSSGEAEEKPVEKPSEKEEKPEEKESPKEKPEEEPEKAAETEEPSKEEEKPEEQAAEPTPEEPEPEKPAPEEPAREKESGSDVQA